MDEERIEYVDRYGMLPKGVIKGSKEVQRKRIAAMRKLVLADAAVRLEQYLSEAEEYCRPIAEESGAKLLDEAGERERLEEYRECVEMMTRMTGEDFSFMASDRPLRVASGWLRDVDAHNRAQEAVIAWRAVLNARGYAAEGMVAETAVQAFRAGYHYACAKLLEFNPLVRREQLAAEVRKRNGTAKQEAASNRKLQAIAEMERRLKKNRKATPTGVAKEMAAETVVDSDGNSVPKWTIKPGKAISARTLQSYYTEATKSKGK